MPKIPVRIGLPKIPEVASRVEGALCEWRDDAYYRIDGYDLMAPFLVAVMSDSDLWMYASSNGGLAAGRRDADGSLFPYETVDKLHRSGAHTGPKTAVRVSGPDATWIWEPFAPDGRRRYEIERALYKHVLGCALWFEETNRSLGLTFRYGWRPSGRFGWVRTSELVTGKEPQDRIEILDGLQNLMPAGVPRALQDASSSLVDAYKTASCDPDSGLALFRLTANIVDRAEANEALRTTVAWHAGLAESTVVLDEDVWDAFVRAGSAPADRGLRGRRGAYLVRAAFSTRSEETRAWHVALDTPVDHAGVTELHGVLAGDAEGDLERDITRGRDRLRTLLAGADAFQATGDALASAHHAANVLFNIARGGVLPDHYALARDDLKRFLETRNRPVAARHAEWLANLPPSLPLPDLHARAATTGDADLARLCDEYLPIVFSRRHGDPSRPWNRFSIVTKNPDGSPRYGYEGNWRDIFQNWEALCASFPECIEPVIAKFVNASTVDGFNPYRITQDGIDWEVPDPDDPWSSIGYWGDHQVVYLTKLLEASLRHHPGRLERWLGDVRFSYADVPYNIKPYADIVADPQDTIEFNPDRQAASDARVAAVGTDGRLVSDGSGGVRQVNLAEKLLVPILAKLSNLVPGGGIWMNTMRPEWNDANNALVGNGMSVVTACYLYRHLGVCETLVAGESDATLDVSGAVVDWMRDVAAVYDAGSGDGDRGRRAFMDAAGEAFSTYRSRAYEEGVGDPTEVNTGELREFLGAARKVVGETIAANRREDGLYHAYNILHLDGGSARVSALPLMLEGQVAVLSSGMLSPADAQTLLHELRASALYREDQNSYVLYPVKTLPGFLEKNRVPESVLESCPTLAARLADGDGTILRRDAEGVLRFHPDCRNAAALRARLGDDIPAGEARAILDAYEAVFDHKSFTGRSGSMYGYEGIGCIYWHMVAKLLLAVRENIESAVASGASADVVAALQESYEDVRGGLGFAKTPEAFGAFPLDPYSHTPARGGAKQPGMTGQVKEEILARFGELGVNVHDGAIAFAPAAVADSEYLTRPATFDYIDHDGAPRTLSLEAGSLAFTVCQVPVVYARDGQRGMTVAISGGDTVREHELNLTLELAAHVFARTGNVTRITVHAREGS